MTTGGGHGAAVALEEALGVIVGTVALPLASGTGVVAFEGAAGVVLFTTTVSEVELITTTLPFM